MYIITAKLRSKETGSITGYRFRDENTGAEYNVELQKARDIRAYVRNAILLNGYYRKKIGYKGIPTITIGHRKKKRAVRIKRDNNIEIKQQLRETNSVCNDRCTNLNTKGKNSDSSSVQQIASKNGSKSINKMEKSGCKHKYIDYEQLYNFDRHIERAYEIRKELKLYNITGLAHDKETSLIYIADALFSDYVLHRANYRAYLEEGLTARMLMELRLNAILPFTGECLTYYTEHNTAETPNDVINIRKKYLRRHLTPFYDNEGWRNFYLVRQVWKGRALGVRIDYEQYFADRKYMQTKSEDDYLDDALEYIIPPMRGDGTGRFDWDRYFADRPEWVDENGNLIEIVEEASRNG